MDKTFDIVALGELLIDFTEYGTSDTGNKIMEVCPGGAPCNMLAMATNLGKKTAIISKVGNDSFGRILIDAANEVGVSSEGVVIDDKIPTTLAFVTTLEGGEREFSFYRKPGADMMLAPEEVPVDLIKSSRVFHFGTLSMTDEPVKSATLRALEVAKESGCIISFDPNLRPPLWDSLDDAKEAIALGLKYCDVLKIADNEIEFFTGAEDYDDGIAKLIEEYNIPLIFLTLGRDGSRAYYKGQRVEVGGFTVDSIEATGAGDCFCGSSISKVLDKGLDKLTTDDLEEMLQFANGAAAIVTTRKGALRSMPDPEEVNALIASK